jgi:hypothetical protein
LVLVVCAALLLVCVRRTRTLLRRTLFSIALVDDEIDKTTYIFLFLFPLLCIIYMKQIPYGAIKTITLSPSRLCEWCGVEPPIDQVIITLHEPDAKGRSYYTLESLVEQDDFVALVRSRVYRHYDDIMGGADGKKEVV